MNAIAADLLDTLKRKDKDISHEDIVFRFVASYRSRCLHSVYHFNELCKDLGDLYRLGELHRLYTKAYRKLNPISRAVQEQINAIRDKISLRQDEKPKRKAKNGA